jgi:hypothetical protein
VNDRDEIHRGWVRLLGFAASVLSAGAMSVVLAAGFLLIVTDNPLACFDGDEPACDDKWVGARLGDVSLQSWAMAGVSLLFSATSFVRAWHLRRPRELALILALCGMSLLGAAFLFARI